MLQCRDAKMRDSNIRVPEMTTGARMSDPIPNQNQSQAQSLLQSLVVSIQSSSDTGLEYRIFSDIASAGRQLGRISDVLAILLDAYKADHTTNSDQQKAFDDFTQMKKDIDAAGEARKLDRIIEGLEALRLEDRASFDMIINKIDEWKANKLTPRTR